MYFSVIIIIQKNSKMQKTHFHGGGHYYFMSCLHNYCGTTVGFQSKKINRIRFFFQESTTPLEEKFNSIGYANFKIQFNDYLSMRQNG